LPDRATRKQLLLVRNDFYLPLASSNTTIALVKTRMHQLTWDDVFYFQESHKATMNSVEHSSKQSLEELEHKHQVSNMFHANIQRTYQVSNNNSKLFSLEV
jgi:hypothetical protein